MYYSALENYFQYILYSAKFFNFVVLDMALFTTPRIEHERTHYSNITWLKTESADQSYLSPPSIVSTTDVIALNEVSLH